MSNISEQFILTPYYAFRLSLNKIFRERTGLDSVSLTRAFCEVSLRVGFFYAMRRTYLLLKQQMLSDDLDMLFIAMINVRIRMFPDIVATTGSEEFSIDCLAEIKDACGDRWDDMQLQDKFIEVCFRVAMEDEREHPRYGIIGKETEWIVLHDFYKEIFLRMFEYAGL